MRQRLSAHARLLARMPCTTRVTTYALPRTSGRRPRRNGADSMHSGSRLQRRTAGVSRRSNSKGDARVLSARVLRPVCSSGQTNTGVKGMSHE